MYTSQDAFNRLVDRLKSQISGAFEIKEVKPLVFSIGLVNYHLLIFYYLPGTDRVEKDLYVSTAKSPIHLDEDLWLTKGELVLNRIRNLTGQTERLYARQGVVARIDKKTALAFQEEHHLHAPLPGKYRYGFFVGGELMSICIFSGGRVMRHTAGYRSFECIRFCTKQGYRVVGGLSKLLTAFYSDFKPDDIMTYVDCDWSDGKKYEKLGFQEKGMIAPQHFLVDRRDHQRQPYRSDTVGHFEAENNDDFYLVVNSGSLKMIKAYIH